MRIQRHTNFWIFNPSFIKIQEARTCVMCNKPLTPYPISAFHESSDDRTKKNWCHSDVFCFFCCLLLHEEPYRYFLVTALTLVSKWEDGIQESDSLKRVEEYLHDSKQTCIIQSQQRTEGWHRENCKLWCIFQNLSWKLYRTIHQLSKKQYKIWVEDT